MRWAVRCGRGSSRDRWSRGSRRGLLRGGVAPRRRGDLFDAHEGIVGANLLGVGTGVDLEELLEELVAQWVLGAEEGPGFLGGFRVDAGVAGPKHEVAGVILRHDALSEQDVQSHPVSVGFLEQIGVVFGSGKLGRCPAETSGLGFVEGLFGVALEMPDVDQDVGLQGVVGCHDAGRGGENHQ